jgi:hypothetical protein
LSFRSTGSRVRYGEIVVENEGIDGTIDPLFTVTRLRLSRNQDGRGDRGETLEVEHWQWDWQDYLECQWPMRILRRWAI